MGGGLGGTLEGASQLHRFKLNLRLAATIDLPLRAQRPSHKRTGEEYRQSAAPIRYVVTITCRIEPMQFTGFLADVLEEASEVCRGLVPSRFTLF